MCFVPGWQPLPPTFPTIVRSEPLSAPQSAALPRAWASSLSVVISLCLAACGGGNSGFAEVGAGDSTLSAAAGNASSASSGGANTVATGGQNATAGTATTYPTVSAPPPATAVTGSTTPAPTPTPDPVSSLAPILPLMPAAGTATLTWAAPQANSDGNALTDLVGFRIYYGTSRGNYTQSIMVGSPGTLSYSIPNLSPGTYYVVVTAINANNNESWPSAEISKTVQ